MTVSRQLTTMLNSLPEAAGKELLQYAEYLRYKYNKGNTTKEASNKTSPWLEFLEGPYEVSDDFMTERDQGESEIRESFD